MTTGRPLLLVAVGVLAVTTTMVFVGGWRTGVSWDETYHVLRMGNFLGPSGWYLLAQDLHGDEPGSWTSTEYVYGPMTMVLLHGLGLLAGTDGSGEISTTASAYAVRHLGVGLLSLLALGAVAGQARLALRDWRWGVVAAAALAAMPAWTGHAMFNIKDIPVASGYTLASFGFGWVAVASRRGHLVAGAAIATAGFVLAIGTRPGIWPGLALAAVAAAALASPVGRRDRLIGIATAVAVGCLVLALVYPAPFGRPFDALFGSVASSSQYGGHTVPRSYVPVFLAAEVPTLLLLLGGVGAVLAVRRLRHDPARVVLVLVLLQAFTLPLLAIARASNLYNGLRQLLFAYPALAVLATLGIAALAVRRLWIVPAVALVAPVVVQLQLFPYNYAYASLPGALLAPSVGDRWPEYRLPTDYWRTSVRELAPEVPEGGFVMCQPNNAGADFMRWSNDGRENCATDVIGPLAPYDDLRRGSWDAVPTAFLAVMSGVDRIGANCERLDDVTRPMYWRTVTMSYVARCDLVVVDYPAGGMRFAGDGHDTSVLLGGWDVHRDRPGIGVRDGRAELGFALPAWAAGHDVVLVGEALGADGLGLQVNGTDVDVEVDGETWTADVPEGDDRLLVTVTAGEDVRLLTMRLQDAS